MKGNNDMKPLTKILHVEDDRDILEIASLTLQQLHGFEVAPCLTWAEALQTCPRFRPDLFLLDVMMPQKTGPELLADLRRIAGFANTPAIFMTAKVQNAELQSLLDAGAIAVITKPFDPMTLGDQIRAAWAGLEAA